VNLGQWYNQTSYSKYRQRNVCIALLNLFDYFLIQADNYKYSLQAYFLLGCKKLNIEKSLAKIKTLKIYPKKYPNLTIQYIKVNAAVVC